MGAPGLSMAGHSQRGTGIPTERCQVRRTPGNEARLREECCLRHPSPASLAHVTGPSSASGQKRPMDYPSDQIPASTLGSPVLQTLSTTTCMISHPASRRDNTTS